MMVPIHTVLPPGIILKGLHRHAPWLLRLLGKFHEMAEYYWLAGYEVSSGAPWPRLFGQQIARGNDIVPCK